MRKILVFWATLLATFNPTGISPLAAVTAVAAQVNTLGNLVKTVPLKMKLDTQHLHPLQSMVHLPDFNVEVGQPLRKAAAKAKARAEQAHKAQFASFQSALKPIIVNTGDAWASLRFCEAGGDYTKNTGNGYFGAYQFDIGTWSNFAGYKYPHLAPPKVQDAKAKDTQARRGWFPWPACARKLGFI